MVLAGLDDRAKEVERADRAVDCDCNTREQRLQVALNARQARKVVAAIQ